MRDELGTSLKYTTLISWIYTNCQIRNFSLEVKEWQRIGGEVYESLTF